MQKIPVVNNEIDTMSLLKKWLEKKTHIVKYTSSGEGVLNIIGKFAPKLLLADILHKEVLQESRNKNKTAKIPVIFMTGYTLRQPRLKSLLRM